MKLSPVIDQLRRYAPTFGGRVAGGLEFEVVRDSALLSMPAAYVVMTADDPGDNAEQTGIRQAIVDEFDVVVALKTGDERGQSVADPLHDIRAELLRALAGWKPSDDYERVMYDGGQLLLIDRGRVLYRFTFRCEWTLGHGSAPETFEELELAGLPPIEGITINLDAIDPMADPNLNKPGPDGRIETVLRVELDEG
ncbi:hypothetical protein AB4Z48_17705 [Cupriavidus sp. 2TAF22]|uniref:phage tail terminator protein n=1 Tax=unclassified Cupriavidus TaxID=2640874 RepID=UPI003F8F9867